jgi:DNA gyrase/topoisomerase IV subunit A
LIVKLEFKHTNRRLKKWIDTQSRCGIMMSLDGYIKLLQQKFIKKSKTGGKGMIGLRVKEEDKN